MKKMKIWNRALALVLSAGMALAPAASVLTCAVPVYADETGGTGETVKANNAVLIYAVGDSSLKTGPSEDVAALTATLQKTDQFKDGNGSIESIGIEQNSQKDALNGEDGKEGLWDKIDAIAEKSTADSLTVIYYSGHGGTEKSGTSYLALQGENNISAKTLREHLRKFSGKVLVIIDACHSSGNIMLSDLGEEGSSSDACVDYNGEAFASELSAIENTTDGENDGPLLYFITAANRAETALQSNTYGGMLTAALENALGHDRKVESYSTYAADTTTKTGANSRDGYAGDGQITMTELVDYYSRTVLVSTSVMFPQQDDTVLFTYSADAGTPATFISSICDSEGNDVQQNVLVNDEGEINLYIKVQNLTNSDLTIMAGATVSGLTGVTARTLEEQKADGECSQYVQWDTSDTVSSNSTKIISTTLTWDAFKETEDNYFNPFTLRVWDCTNKNYNTLGFYTSKTEGNGEIDDTKLALQVPTQMSTEGSAGNRKLVVTKTSSILPMEIVYDDRTINRESNAACKLSLYAYDLGTELPTSLHVDVKDSSVLRNMANVDVLSTLPSTAVTTIFKDIRPVHERKVDNDTTSRDSVFTYPVDTSLNSWVQGHYYALQVQCVYDDSKSHPTKSVWTVVQKVTASEVDQETYKIPSFICTQDEIADFWKYYGGIRLESWENSIAYAAERTVDETSKRMLKALNNYEYNDLFSYSIEGTDADGNSSTGWCKWDDTQKDWVPMGADDVFEEGKKYASRLTITIASNYKAEFTSETKFSFFNHDLVGNVKIYANGQVADSGKTAVLWLEHYVPVMEESALRMYQATDGNEWEEIPATTTLKVGDEVVLGASGTNKCNYDWKVLRGLEKTKKTVTKGGEKWTVYKVVMPDDEQDPSAEIVTWNTGNKKVEGDSSTTETTTKAISKDAGGSADGNNSGTTNGSGSNTGESCYCATDLYVWKIAPAESSSGSNVSSSSSDQSSQETPATAGTTSTLNYICSENQMANYLTAGGGIPVGTGWNAGSVSGVNSQVQNNLFQLFLTNTMGSRYNQQVTWSQYDAGTGVETVLGSGATFQMGQQYVSTVTISVPNGSSERFNASSSFKFGNHKLLGNPVISADGKTATVKVLHTVPQMDENAIKLYMADTGAEITADTQLQPGDLVRISAADGYGYYILGGLRTSGTDGVYTVEYCQSASGLLGGIEIMFYLKEQLAGCNCGTLLYKHAVGGVGGYGQVVSLGQSGSSVKGAENGTSVVSLGLVNGQTYSRGGAVGGTGDEGRLILWLLLSVSSAAGLAEIYLLESRRRVVRRRKAMRRRTQR